MTASISYPNFYQCNYGNSTNPLPPPVSSAVSALSTSMVIIGCFGALACLLL